MMTDTVRGPVVQIVDGDTFYMKVTHLGKRNEYPYQDREKIRIDGIDADEWWTDEGKRSKDSLRNKLMGKTIRCYVQARDTYGRLVCRVKILD